MDECYSNEQGQVDPLAVPVKIRKSSDGHDHGQTPFDQHVSDFMFDQRDRMPSEASAVSDHSKMGKTPRMPSTLDDFEVLSTIGSGSYGTCKKVRRKRDGKVLAWKEMDYGSMTESEKQMLVSEVNLLRELRHQNIVRYYDRIIDRSKTKIYIIMEYCDGGDLATLISRCRREGSYVEEDTVWKIIIQMMQALKECHRRKNGKAVLHRDLKPANIFLDSEENVKLGDFGLARVLHHETSFAKTYVGTPYYMSPELVNSMSYNEKSDIWSMGCLLYELCALHPPFTATNQHELNRKIRNGEFKRIPLRYSESLNLIVSKLLKVEVDKRPSIDDVLNDPIVLRKKGRLEKKNIEQIDSPHRVSSPSSLQQWENELKERETKIKARERELEEYYAEREKQISVKEKLVEEKLKRAELLMREFGRRGSFEPSTKPSGDAGAEDLSEMDGRSSCLARGKRDPDTPKKKVTFDMYGKENLRQREKYGSYLSSYTSESSDYNDTYLRELAKRRELKDKLFKVKARAMEYRGYDDDVKPKSNNLLYFR